MQNLPATTEQIDNLRAFAAAARSRKLEGTVLKYTKGMWTAGKDETVMNDRQLVALVPQISVGWTKWENKKPVEATIGLVVEGYKPPRRSDLPDLDDSTWEKDKRGEPKDPWLFGMHLQLVDQESGEAFAFSTSSRGGKDALADLVTAYCEHREARGGNDLPVVELRSGSYAHPDYGQVHVPQLDILKWVSGESEESKDETPPTHKNDGGGDFDDEIPF
jgi:hypothetical protein